MIDRDTALHFARRVILGYRRFVTAGKYTWREAIPRSYPHLKEDADISAIEREIGLVLESQAAGRTHEYSPLHDPTQIGHAAPAIPKSGRRVIRKGHEFS